MRCITFILFLYSLFIFKYPLFTIPFDCIPKISQKMRISTKIKLRIMEQIELGARSSSPERIPSSRNQVASPLQAAERPRRLQSDYRQHSHPAAPQSLVLETPHTGRQARLMPHRNSEKCF